jgi:acetylornithine deacetylase/succinyl-diaminopimelate desuccinylase-like protein
MQSAFDGPIVELIGQALRRHDPSAVPVPYMVSASTDAAHFAELGLLTYGFSPLRLPVGFHFGAMFHGADERVPVDGLEFGVTVLDDLLRHA